MVQHWLKFSFLAHPHESLSKQKSPELWLGLAMGLFYLARWLNNQTPASHRGLIFPAEDFYLYSACLSPLLWPVLTRFTSRLMTRLSDGTKSDTVLFSHAYAAPLLIWLGCFEFLVWLVAPPKVFGGIALCLMGCAMSVVYVQCLRLFEGAGYPLFSRHFRTIASLVPQLLVATLIFR